MSRRRRPPAPKRVEPQRALSPEQRAFVQYLVEEAVRQLIAEHEENEQPPRAA